MKLFGFMGNLADFVVTNLNRLFEWLRILSTPIALFVFLFSVVSPFYNWSFSFLETSAATYWSYRVNYFFFPWESIHGSIGSLIIGSTPIIKAKSVISGCHGFL